MALVNNYGTPNNIKVALRRKEFLGDDHGMLKWWGIDMRVINNYGTPNNIERSLRTKEFLGDDHGMLKCWGVINKDERRNEISLDELRERVMQVVNHYRTPEMKESLNRLKKQGTSRGVFKENEFRVNKIKFFKDIPDDVEILIDYVDETAIRTMNIPLEIIYESIYRELPELFDE